ncbi:hypothetical protein B0H13DRAFT_2280005 [Mycena leptocephala]|nr:hypothetical protein B0H13DRAFT_2280005 [Mycena leptocephala]
MGYGRKRVASMRDIPAGVRALLLGPIVVIHDIPLLAPSVPLHSHSSSASGHVLDVNARGGFPVQRLCAWLVVVEGGRREAGGGGKNNNFGKGDAGNDRVTVSFQNPTGIDNADFSTPQRSFLPTSFRVGSREPCVRCRFAADYK